jgi:hypothetical protein
MQSQRSYPPSILVCIGFLRHPNCFWHLSSPRSWVFGETFSIVISRGLTFVRRQRSLWPFLPSKTYIWCQNQREYLWLDVTVRNHLVSLLYHGSLSCLIATSARLLRARRIPCLAIACIFFAFTLYQLFRVLQDGNDNMVFSVFQNRNRLGPVISLFVRDGAVFFGLWDSISSLCVVFGSN